MASKIIIEHYFLLSDAETSLYIRGKVINMKYFQLIIIPLGLLLQACGSSDESKNDGKSSKQTDPVNNEITTHDLINMDALPSPVRISYLFYQAHLEFNPSILLLEDHVSKLTLSTEKMIAFGIYSSDLAYAAFNKKEDYARNRFVILEKLGSDLGFGFPEEHQDLISRLEKNLTQVDSVIQMLSQYQMLVDEYMRQNEEEDKALIIFASAWIETLYLGCSVKNLELNGDLLETLVYQEELCNTLLDNLSRLKGWSDDPYYNRLVTQMKNISNGFNKLGANPDDDEMEIKREDLHRLIDSIFEARKAIIQIEAA